MKKRKKCKPTHTRTHTERENRTNVFIAANNGTVIIMHVFINRIQHITCMKSHPKTHTEKTKTIKSILLQCLIDNDNYCEFFSSLEFGMMAKNRIQKNIELHQWMRIAVDDRLDSNGRRISREKRINCNDFTDCSLTINLVEL